MQRTLRFLGLVAVIGAFAIVAAQSSSARKEPGSQPVQGGAAANPSVSGHANHVLILLSQYFSNVQLDQIDWAQEKGRQDRVDPIIRANCSANLWLLTPDKQALSIAHMEIEKYRGKDPLWTEVANSPSLVKSLLKVSKATDAKVSGFLDAVWKPILNQDRAFKEQLMKSAEWKNAKSQQERNVLHYERLKVYRANHPLPPLKERRAATHARYLKAIDETMKLLTPEQAKEMKMLKTRFEVSMNAAVNGDRP